MISILRRFIDSKIGLTVIFVFLGIIAFAFAAGDITGLGGLPRLASGGDTLAKVGGHTLTGVEMSERIQTIYRQERQRNPELTLAQMIAQGAFESIMQQRIGSLAMVRFAADQEIVISKRMVDSDIAAIPSFQGPGGSFSDAAFRNTLKQLDITEKDLRQDIEDRKVARQLLTAASVGAVLPDSLVLPYASLLLEVRQGQLLGIPSTALVTPEPPDEKALAAFYARTSQAFLIPEQRSLRYAVIDGSSFDKSAVPTDADIAAFYAGNKANYAARQTRSVEQLVVLTEAAARTISAAVAKGETLGDAAKKAGLATSKLADETQATLTAKIAADVARQVFAAGKDSMVGPVKTSLGWALIKVTAINNIPAKTLDEARASIVAVLSVDKARALFADTLRKIEDQAQDGATFDEIVKDRKLTVVTTPPLIKEGKNLSNPAFAADADIKGILPVAFEGDASEDAVLAEIVPEKRYALVDVVDIIPAAPPPLAKVRDAVVQAYKMEVAKGRSRILAEAIQKKVNAGKDLAAAAAESGFNLPPIELFGGQRAKVMSTQNVPPPLVILFSMSRGATKVLELKNNDGYVVIHLDKIVPSDAASQPVLVSTTRTELQKAVGFEHADQLEKAIEKEVGLKTFPAVVDRVKADLARSGSGG